MSNFNVRMPARLSETPYEIRRAPMLGEHNEYVCTELLGMSDDEFVQLIADGVAIFKLCSVQLL